MLLTISTTHRPADDLSYLLHKHPARFQTFELGPAKAHVFYSEAGIERCTACLQLEVNTVALVRSQQADQGFALGQYVNDRPYTASSFLSVAIAQVFGTALQGRCRDRPGLASTPIPLEARLDVLAVRGGEAFLRGIYEPLGYEVEAQRHPLDDQFPEWGESPYFSVVVRKTTPLAELLKQLYFLIPVFDNQKHYFVGAAELHKLLAKGEGWLAGHPLKDEIARRYLRFQPKLYREALRRLDHDTDSDGCLDEPPGAQPLENSLETPLSLNEQRLMSVMTMLRSHGARRVLDLGCGEGKLLRKLLRDPRFEEIVGMDVSIRSLEIAAQRLKLEELPDHQAKRVQLMHGSLMYRDQRLAGFDAATVVEVVEHLDPPRLKAFERVLFEFAQPRCVILTTPNREFNVTWPTLPAGAFRHSDHRFEWTRDEFQTWASRVAERFGYTVRFQPVGPEHAEYGAPTQMGVFTRP
jgi:3' terminal RNA ribose 2'-O-methyltransferase Hen1